jgi:hypothetical protein
LKNGILINYGICGVLGILLNTLILAVLISKVKKGKAHVDIKLCLFIVSIDMVISIGMIFRSIFMKYPYNLIKYHDAWCKVEVLIMGQLLICSSYSLAVMAIERFLLICFNIKLSACFWFSFLALAWVIELSCGSICAYYNYNILTRTETYCTFSFTGVCRSGFIVNICIFYFSFFSVSICYFGIVTFKIKQCLNQIKLNVPKGIVYKELRSTLVSSFINILVYYLVFSGKLFVFTYELSTGKKRKLLLDVVSLMLISYTCIANAIILLFMNLEVRKNFFMLLKNAKFRLFNQ